MNLVPKGNIVKSKFINDLKHSLLCKQGMMSSKTIKIKTERNGSYR